MAKRTSPDSVAGELAESDTKLTVRHLDRARHLDGAQHRPGPGLSLRPRAFLECRPRARQGHAPARSQQSGRPGLDRPFERALRHPRYAAAVEDWHLVFPRLRTPDELGCPDRGRPGQERHSGHLRALTRWTAALQGCASEWSSKLRRTGRRARPPRARNRAGCG